MGEFYLSSESTVQFAEFTPEDHIARDRVLIFPCLNYAVAALIP